MRYLIVESIITHTPATRVIAVTLLLTALTAFTGCGAAARGGARGGGDHHGERAYRYFMDGDMPAAIGTYKRGFAAARRADNVVGAARSLSNIGRAYYEWGRVDSAGIFFARAHEEFNHLGNAAEASRAAAWIALCFASTGDEPRARQWFDTAIASVDMNRPEANGHYYAVIKAMIDVTLTHRVGDENALYAAARFYRGKKNHSALTTISILMADVELARGDCAAASRHLLDALASTDHSRELYRRRGVLLTLSKINFCTGNDAAGKHYYNRAFDTAPRGVPIPAMDEASSCESIGCR